MYAQSTTEEIQQLKRRLSTLQEEAEDVIRQQLKEARKVVADLEMELSNITGRPSASEIKAAYQYGYHTTRTRRSSITDEKLEIRILSLLHQEGQGGMNAKTIAEKLEQSPVRIRQWIGTHPTVLKRVGKGPGTRFFVAS